MHWRDGKPLKFSQKNLQIVLCGVLMVALVLLCWPQVFSSSEQSTDTTSTTGEAFDPVAEKENLEEILSSIKNAGTVQVMVTYDGEAEKVPAYDTDSTTSSTVNADSGTTNNQSTSAKPVSGSDDLVVITEKRPEVLGVVVVAEGASDLSVKLALSRAVQTALGVEASKVEVFEMKP